MQSVDDRHMARMIVLQKLFERYFKTEDISKGFDNEFTNEDLLTVNESSGKYDKKLADQLLHGTIKYAVKADAIIEKLAPAWPIDQINKVDLQILRIAIFEGFISKITPKKVSIDEAVELAKEFGGKPSANFVNGVLGTLLSKETKFNKLLKANK